jgi:hypothetical protein
MGISGRRRKNKMKTNAITDALIKKLEGFRIDGFLSDMLLEGLRDYIYSGWLSGSVIYGVGDGFLDEIDPELLRIIHTKREGREELEFRRAMSMVIIRKVLEEGLMVINYDGPGLISEKKFASWPLSVDGSVQKVYDLWEEAFSHSETDIDAYLFALWNTDLGNEIGKSLFCNRLRGEIADAEKAIELEPDVIKHYVERGNKYYLLSYYESEPIKEAEHRKKIREIAETIRKMDPDDTRHDKRDRADAYHFFSRIEPDREKAREYRNKAYTIAGLDDLVDAEEKRKANELATQKMFKTFLETEENRIDDLVKAMEIDSQTAKEFKESISNLKKTIEHLRKYL